MSRSGALALAKREGETTCGESDVKLVGSLDGGDGGDNIGSTGHDVSTGESLPTRLDLDHDSRERMHVLELPELARKERNVRDLVDEELDVEEGMSRQAVVGRELGGVEQGRRRRARVDISDGWVAIAVVVDGGGVVVWRKSMTIS